jgi:hypothetical protein
MASTGSCSTKTSECYPECAEGYEPVPDQTDGSSVDGGGQPRDASRSKAADVGLEADSSVYACGSNSCTIGQTFCYSFAGGVSGAGTSRSCMTLPAACAKNPTCACVCPPVSSPSIGGTFEGGFGSSCSCSEENGELAVSCAGA